MRRVFVAGHRGMVGSALVRKLTLNGDVEVVTASRSELNLLSQSQVSEFFRDVKIDEIYLSAAKVGGIGANNNFPADFIYQNLMIQSNLISAAHKADIKKLLFLGSSCIYPKISPQPIPESALLTGRLEPTNEPYAIAKIAGIKMCESYNRQFGTDFRCVMPTNLYGPGDNYDPENSHVMAALLKRFTDAVRENSRSVLVWGSGKPRREFLYVDDLAEACLFLMAMERSTYHSIVDPQSIHVNVGSGTDISINDLAHLIADLAGFSGRILFDSSRPDGTPVKLMDSSRVNNLGWFPATKLEDGIRSTLASL